MEQNEKIEYTVEIGDIMVPLSKEKSQKLQLEYVNVAFKS